VHEDLPDRKVTARENLHAGGPRAALHIADGCKRADRVIQSAGHHAVKLAAERTRGFEAEHDSRLSRLAEPLPEGVKQGSSEDRAARARVEALAAAQSELYLQHQISATEVKGQLELLASSDYSAGLKPRELKRYQVEVCTCTDKCLACGIISVSTTVKLPCSSEHFLASATSNARRMQMARRTATLQRQLEGTEAARKRSQKRLDELNTWLQDTRQGTQEHKAGYDALTQRLGGSLRAQLFPETLAPGAPVPEQVLKQEIKLDTEQRLQAAEQAADRARTVRQNRISTAERAVVKAKAGAMKVRASLAGCGHARRQQPPRRKSSCSACGRGLSARADAGSLDFRTSPAIPLRSQRDGTRAGVHGEAACDDTGARRRGCRRG
jgi:hypothetical protein